MTPINRSHVDALQPQQMKFLKDNGTEVVIGIVGAIGINHSNVIEALRNRFRYYQYETNEIRLSKAISQLIKEDPPKGKYERATFLIKKGNEIRERYKDCSILALDAVRSIYRHRKSVGELSEDEKVVSVTLPRRVTVISSLKRPEEVEALRNIYPKGFYLIGVYSSPGRRRKSLMEDGEGMDEKRADELIHQDEDEFKNRDYGQRTRDTFHLSDFYVEEEGDSDFFKAQINRTVDLIFGAPYETPTFDEYAMFHAFAASLRSADLSRQVGAVIAKNNEIIASGANDCPRPGGGLFWCGYDKQKKEFGDEPEGRDYVKGYDMNARERSTIFGKVVEYLESHEPSSSTPSALVIEALENSGLKDITEYGRMVHAEMEALLCCSRNSISCQDAILYGTTFPCHNCAKHIIASGIKEVVYVEPYPKSKTMAFYGDMIDRSGRLKFRPFIGVGARQFLSLFSMALGSGLPIERKDKHGDVLKQQPETMMPRVAVRPYSFLDVEQSVEQSFSEWDANQKQS